jgi:hypothetical protein
MVFMLFVQQTVVQPTVVHITYQSPSAELLLWSCSLVVFFAVSL